MMQALCVFGDRQPEETKALAFDGTRTDVPQNGELTEWIRPLVGTGLYYCFILHDIARNAVLLDAMRDTDFDTQLAYIEPFNEREQGRVTPQIMIDAINALYHDCTARGFQGRIVASGDSNLNTDMFNKDDSLDFYRAVAPKLPKDCIVAFHDYPYKDQLQYRPWPPHRTHEQEIEEFLSLIGGRPPACSEFGFHMAQETSGRLTEQQVYDRDFEYLVRYEHYGLLFAALYQWNDGLVDTAMGRYGIHHADAVTRKRQAYVVQDWRGLQHGQ